MGQGYDGAASLAGHVSGAAVEVKKEAEMADYFHCASHATNLSCSKIATVPVIRNAQDTMANVINHFNYSVKRCELLKKHVDRINPSQSSRLITLCSTRFVERHASVARFWACLPAILNALEDMEEWDDREASSKANSLRCCLERSETIVGLACLQYMSALLLPVSRALQSESNDLIRALDIVKGTKKALLESRTESQTSFGKIYESVLSLAGKIGVDIDQPRIPSRSKYRASALSEANDIPSYYRLNVFIPLLDAVLVDFTDRFSSHFEKTAALSALIPNLIAARSWEDFKPAFEKYSTYVEDTESEFRFEFEAWKRFCAELDKEGENESYSAIKSLNVCPKDIFPNVFVFLQILATLPVTTCEAERMFSAVERTLTAIRSSMGEERLEALLLCQTHRDLLPSPDQVVTTYANSSRRLPYVL